MDHFLCEASRPPAAGTYANTPSLGCEMSLPTSRMTGSARTLLACRMKNPFDDLSGAESRVFMEHVDPCHGE